MCQWIIVNFNANFRQKNSINPLPADDISTFPVPYTSKQPQHNQLASATGQWLSGHNLFAFFIHGQNQKSVLQCRTKRRQRCSTNQFAFSVDLANLVAIDDPARSRKRNRKCGWTLKFGQPNRLSSSSILFSIIIRKFCLFGEGSVCAGDRIFGGYKEWTKSRILEIYDRKIWALNWKALNETLSIFASLLECLWH